MLHCGCVAPIFAPNLIVSRDAPYHPDIFEEAMRRIGGNKEETMVFEDALYAANTLKANGFRYTIIEDPGNILWRDEIKIGCEKYIKGYGELL